MLHTWNFCQLHLKNKPPEIKNNLIEKWARNMVSLQENEKQMAQTYKEMF